MGFLKESCCWWWWWWWMRTNEASHRSMRQRFWVLMNPCSEPSLSRPTMPVKERGGGQFFSFISHAIREEEDDMDDQCRYVISPSWVSHLPVGYSCTEQGLRNIQELNIIILWLAVQYYDAQMKCANICLVQVVASTYLQTFLFLFNLSLLVIVQPVVLAFMCVWLWLCCWHRYLLVWFATMRRCYQRQHFTV
jgi:hypothetical protein